jgi:hypothetical protein
LAPGVQINTDDRNVVEFGFARSLGRDYQMVSQIRTLAQSGGATRPPVEGGAVDWSVVDMAWVSQIASGTQLRARNSARKRPASSPGSTMTARLTDWSPTR